MTRLLPLFATGLMAVMGSLSGNAAAQQPPAASAPEPKMPPMPSMEGQQGDVSKPVTQIPSRKKAPAPEKKGATKKPARPAAAHKKH